MKVHAYANLAGPGDDVTSRLRSRVDVWRPIAGRTDEEVARQIVNDGIEVLVDLSGHTAGHRLGVFARQPAPVQNQLPRLPGDHRASPHGIPTHRCLGQSSR